jgi:hypothetical protein
MSKEEVNKREYDGQIIVKDGKYFGYSLDDSETIISDRAWRDSPTEAIIWNTKLTDVNKVYKPEKISMEGAKLIGIRKTVTIKQR